jgi:hypothetical protein
VWWSQCAVSAFRKTATTAGLLILGGLSIQGDIEGVNMLAEPLATTMENNARRALVPLENSAPPGSVWQSA